MSISAMDRTFRHEIGIYKQTNYLVEDVGVTATITPNIQPTEAGVFLEVLVEDWDKQGSIRVIGNREGKSIQEDIYFDEFGMSLPSRNRYDSIDRIEPQLLTAGRVSLLQIRAQGEPILFDSFVKTIWGSITAKVGLSRQIVYSMGAGEMEAGGYTLSAYDDKQIRVLPPRILKCDGRSYRVTFITPAGPLGNINADLKLL